jgi:excisionase family DNA binding protein
MMVSVKGAAAQMGVSSAIVYALCAAGRLRHSRVGLRRGKIVISEEAISDYLRSTERGPAQVEVLSVAPRALKSRPIDLRHLRPLNA